ncbi:clumping factor B-like [Entelurus aequoreus]|uniref:clumping factor B-like n=1 Tax=Entelurus aequoreus TaxID=161455 RepID=UPI002B1DF663|nr:clumping factor B-like [Entelurus aequoreus]
MEEGRGDGRCSGYRIPLELGRGEPNLRFRRFCISLHSDEISFIISAAPRQSDNDIESDDNNEAAHNEDHGVAGDNIEDTDEEGDNNEENEDVIVDSDSEREEGEADNADTDSDGHNEDSDNSSLLEADHFAWIRFIWQVWPFSCGNIFEEIVFEFHGVHEEDLIISAFDVIQEHVEENDGNDNIESDDHVGEDNEGEADVVQCPEEVEEISLPLPLPLVSDNPKHEEREEKDVQWWHDYNSSESVDEEDPDPQDGKAEKSGPRVDLSDKRDHSTSIGDLAEEREAPDDCITCFGNPEAEEDPLPGPSRKRPRDEGSRHQFETGRRKRFCPQNDNNSDGSPDLDDSKETHE